MMLLFVAAGTTSCWSHAPQRLLERTRFQVGTMQCLEEAVYHSWFYSWDFLG